MTNTNTSRPMHLGQDPYNDQFSNFDGSNLGSYGLEPLMPPEQQQQPQADFVIDGQPLPNLTDQQRAALIKKMQTQS